MATHKQLQAALADIITSAVRAALHYAEAEATTGVRLSGAVVGPAVVAASNADAVTLPSVPQATAAIADYLVEAP